jgi:hypothetical protein
VGTRSSEVPRILKHTKSYLRAGCSADFDTTVPVLLFRANSYVIEHGTLGVVRSLGRLGIPVYAMVEHRFSPIVASRYLAGSFVKETSNMDEGRRMEWLGNLGVRLSRPASGLYCRRFRRIFPDDLRINMTCTRCARARV